MGKGMSLYHIIYNNKTAHDNNNTYADKSYLIISIAFFLLIFRFMFIYCTCSKKIYKKNLNNTRYTKINFDSNIEYYESCTICLEDFDYNEKILQLKCNHIYHEKCIKTWFTKKSNCPNCNNSFSSDDNISPISTPHM